MWGESGCVERIQHIMDGKRELYLYGDPAYQCTEGIMAPYTCARGHRYLPSKEKQFNAALSSVRIAVENAFGLTQQLWTYAAFDKGLQSQSQPVAAHFKAAILLTNCYTCIRGNLIGARFLVPPPTVEEYLLCTS
jgi:hypothetical protein